MLTRLSIFLMAALLVSAFYQIQLQYHSRRVVTELDRARSQGTRLAAERERLEVERRTAAKALRVEALATEQLHMQVVTPAITEYVQWTPRTVLAPVPTPESEPEAEAEPEAPKASAPPAEPS